MCPIISAAELGDDFAERPAPIGEYDVRIVKAEIKDTKDGARQRLAYVGTIEGEDYAAIMDGINFPKKDGTDERFRQQVRELQMFFKLFGVDSQVQMDVDVDAKLCKIVNEADIPSLLTGQVARCGLVLGDGMNEGEKVNRIRLPRR